MKPLNAIKTLFNKVENELTDGELSEIGLVLIRALKGDRFHGKTYTEIN